MAKSIRSKRKRMLRSIKRVRYAKKELKKLKDMLGIKDNTNTEEVKQSVSDVANVIEFSLPARKETEDEVKKNLNPEDGIKGYSFGGGSNLVIVSDDSSDDDNDRKKGTSKPAAVERSTTDVTEMDHSQKRVYNRKTMQDQFGNYPPWLNSKGRKKYRLKSKLKKRMQNKIKKKQARKGKSKRSKRNCRMEVVTTESSNDVENNVSN